MKRWIKAFDSAASGKRDLHYDEAVEAADFIARGEATDAQIASFLMALQMKGETDDEVLAFIDVLRAYQRPLKRSPHTLLHVSEWRNVRAFPVSLVVSLLLASVGFGQIHQAAAQPQGRYWLGRLGLGPVSPLDWERSFGAARIGYLLMDEVCPPLGRIRGICEEMGLDRLLGTVEQALNPLRSDFLLIGVRDPQAMGRWLTLLPRAGFQTAYLVEGADGGDALALERSSAIRKVTEWGDEASTVDPQTFGFPQEALPLRSEEEAEDALKRILDGGDDPELRAERAHIVFNAGMQMYWFDKIASYEDAFHLAGNLLQRREAAKVMARWKEAWEESARRPAPPVPAEAAEGPDCEAI